jgi:hypothetical protein
MYRMSLHKPRMFYSWNLYLVVVNDNSMMTGDYERRSTSPLPNISQYNQKDML